jgi:hypothetical protein
LRRCDQISDRCALRYVRYLGKVRTGARNAICIIGNRVIIVGTDKIGFIFKDVANRVKTASNLGRIGTRDNTYYFTGKFCVGICRASVKRLGINYLDVGFFCSFVESRVTHVVTVSGKQTDAAMTRGET